MYMLDFGKTFTYLHMPGCIKTSYLFFIPSWDHRVFLIITLIGLGRWLVIVVLFIAFWAPVHVLKPAKA